MKTIKSVCAVITLMLVAGCNEERVYKPFAQSSFEFDGCKFTFIKFNPNGNRNEGLWVAKCRSNEDVALEYKTTSGNSTISNNIITQMERTPPIGNNGGAAINANGKSGVTIFVDGKVVKVEGAE